MCHHPSPTCQAKQVKTPNSKNPKTTSKKLHSRRSQQGQDRCKLHQAQANFQNKHHPPPKHTKNSTHTGKTKRSPCNRRQCQRYSRCLCKQRKTSLARQLHWEEARKHNQNAQLDKKIYSRVHDLYNFVPNLSLSTHLNARKVLGDTEPRTYFSRPHNLAFHDLTKQKNTHPSASQLLGLSLKFIPTPKYTSG